MQGPINDHGLQGHRDRMVRGGDRLPDGDEFARWLRLIGPEGWKNIKLLQRFTEEWPASRSSDLRIEFLERCAAASRTQIGWIHHLLAHAYLDADRPDAALASFRICVAGDVNASAKHMAYLAMSRIHAAQGRDFESFASSAHAYLWHRSSAAAHELICRARALQAGPPAMAAILNEGGHFFHKANRLLSYGTNGAPAGAGGGGADAPQVAAGAVPRTLADESPVAPLREPEAINGLHYCIADALHRAEVHYRIDVHEVEPGVIAYSSGRFSVFDGDGRIIPHLSSLYSPDLGDGESPKVALEIDGRAAVLVDSCDVNNLCHWLYDWLPRVDLYRRSGVPVTHWLVQELSEPFQAETLGALGIDLGQVVCLQDHSLVRARRLVMLSNQASQTEIEDADLQHPARLAWPRHLDFLRRHLLPLGRVSAAPQGPARLLISREDAEGRHVIGEDRLASRLVADLGFVKFVPTRYSYAEQVSAFARAEIVVGAHGAGLANILYCSPGARLYEIFSPRYGTDAYFRIASALGLHYVCVTGRDEAGGRGGGPPEAEVQGERFNARNICLDDDLIAAIVKHVGGGAG